MAHKEIMGLLLYLAQSHQLAVAVVQRTNCKMVWLVVLVAVGHKPLE
jgi:hypothetical protein